MTSRWWRSRYGAMLLALLLLGSMARAQAAWPATDALGRSLPTPADVGPPKPNRWVGIFYFIDHDAVTTIPGGGPPDVSKIMASDPQALSHDSSPPWGPPGVAHFWGEPLFGYYQSTDAWVLRRHAQLLSAAGVDTLIFDTTNAETYPAAYQRLCQVFASIREQGGQTPQIAFMVNTQAGATAERLYRDLYQPGAFKALWFMWQGKPLLICDPAEASPEVREFFTLRKAHWPFQMVNTPNAWHWEAAYPQPYGYTDDPARPEEVNVSVAQNLRSADGIVTNMSDLNARGRGFHDGHNDSSRWAIDSGANFAEQWRRALEMQPPFVMVTGWNEWIAGRFDGPAGRVRFVDQFNREFSRDIEPMHGGHQDNFYYQLVDNIRRYKGLDPLPTASGPSHIDPTDNLQKWDAVRPLYSDDIGDITPRDADGAGGLHYNDNSGRNDLIRFKVARDEKNLYFLAETHAPVTPSSDPNWMWLLLDTDSNARTGWKGYDFIVNRTVDADGSTWLEKNTGGWNWQKVAKLPLFIKANTLQLVIPRQMLGIGADDRALSFNFKWADNLQEPGDIMGFYLSGDVAPEGRFMFRYEATPGH